MDISRGCCLLASSNNRWSMRSLTLCPPNEGVYSAPALWLLALKFVADIRWFICWPGRGLASFLNSPLPLYHKVSTDKTEI